jgi:ABC-type transporter Mla maintaining outer membrane lipid asymmetry permease subunit MlaE
MKRPIRIVDALVVVVKALLIAGAILWLGGYFGLHVREAGGSVTYLNMSDAHPT